MPKKEKDPLEDPLLDKDISVPEGADEESKKIAAEAKAAADKGNGTEKPEEPPKKEAEEPEKPKKEEAGEKGEKDEGKPEGEPEGGDKKEDEPPKRTPKLMEVYKHKIAQKKWDEEKLGLNEKITELERTSKAKPPPERKEAIAKFAEEHGLEPKMVTGLLDIMGAGQTDLKKEIDSLRTEIEKGRVTREQAHQEGEFAKDYTKTIIPILDDEKVSSEKRKEIKELIHTLAFTAEFASYGLDDIYFKAKRRGDLDEIIGKGKKSAESGKTTHGKAGEGEDKPFMGEGAMSNEEFDKVSEEEAEKEPKFKISHKGEKA